MNYQKPFKKNYIQTFIFNLIPVVFFLFAVSGCGKSSDSENTTSESKSVSATGAKGENGEKGDPGATGPAGPQGLTGVKGDTGSTGPQGAIGPQGPTGETGLTGATGATGQAGVAGKDAYIPAGIWLDGVNKISFFSTELGLVMQSQDTSGVPNQPGAFNGATNIGNKAIVSLNLFSGMLVSDLDLIQVRAKQDRGTPFFYINLFIDCNGNGVWEPGTDTIVTVDSTAVPDLNLKKTDFTTISLSKTLKIYKSVGGKCGLPLHTGSVSDSLQTLISANPNAKFINAVTGDGGMPRGAEIGSISFIMNDSANNQARSTIIESACFNTSTQNYLFNFKK